MSACGLDFGTSNTTLGVRAGASAMLVHLEGSYDTVPSAVFYPQQGNPLIGRAAIKAYVEGNPGRLMRSLKSVLGSRLIEETTQVGRHRVRFHEVIGHFLGAVKRRAEMTVGHELSAVVHGRPVFFVDGDPAADAKAEETLLRIARGIGFRDVSFQFEPIAAALDYESQISGEELALIADIGGGTSDFSIVRLSPDRHRQTDRKADILANDGVRIGGTDYDRRLSLGVAMPLLGYQSAMKRAELSVPSSYFHDLATWSSINRLYNHKTAREIREVWREAAQPELIARLAAVVDREYGHTLAMAIEEAKIALSDTDVAAIEMDWIEPGLSASLGIPEAVEHTSGLTARIGAVTHTCLRSAGIGAEDIDAVFLTGGTTRLAHVRSAIIAALPAARVIDGDTFGSVGKGLTIEAANRYGASLAA